MNPLLLPLLPGRLALRALDDLHVLATAARDVQARADRVEDAIVELLAMGHRIEGAADEFLALVRQIDERALAVLALGERIDGRAEAVLALGEKIDHRGGAIVDEGAAIRASAAEITERAQQVLEALPLLERAVAMAQPLEGAVERLGRVADRLPGGRTRRDLPPRP